MVSPCVWMRLWLRRLDTKQSRVLRLLALHLHERGHTMLLSVERPDRLADLDLRRVLGVHDDRAVGLEEAMAEVAEVTQLSTVAQHRPTLIVPWRRGKLHLRHVLGRVAKNEHERS